MKTLVGTLCGGGQVSAMYHLAFGHQCMLNPDRLKEQKKYNIGQYLLWKESLISRGRNHIAQVAMSQKWDRLFFIDADMYWQWPHMKAVIDACDASEGRGVVAGSAPRKEYPLRLNFMPYPDDEKYFLPDNQPSAGGMIAMAIEKDTPLIPVPYIGTAFMCIDVKVFHDLADKTPWYMYPNPTTGESEKHWDFFPVGPVKNQFVSEDWGFCHLAREAGHGVYLHADVIVDHVGGHVFHVDTEAELKAYAESRGALLAPRGLE